MIKTKIDSGEYYTGIIELISEAVTNSLTHHRLSWDDCDKFLNLSFDYLVNEVSLCRAYKKNTEETGELTVVTTICDTEENVFEHRGATNLLSDLIIKDLKDAHFYEESISFQLGIIRASIAESLAIVDAWVASQPTEKGTDDE